MNGLIRIQKKLCCRDCEQVEIARLEAAVSRKDAKIRAVVDEYRGRMQLGSSGKTVALIHCDLLEALRSEVKA
jgi:hypothetical protein